MRLTSFTDFALRALMRLAGEPGRSFATNEIAAEFGISRNHLAKVVRDLADSGFISTQRGVGGGFTLARPAQSITIGEVVRALEGPPLVECFREDGGNCVLKPRCRLKAKLAAAREAFMRELDATTLAECAYPATARREPGARMTAATKHQVQSMKPIEFENGVVQIDAAIVAEGLGLAPLPAAGRDARGQDHEPCRARGRRRFRPASPDLLLRTPAVSRRGRRNRRDHSTLGDRLRRFAAAEVGAQGRQMRPGG